MRTRRGAAWMLVHRWLAVMLCAAAGHVVSAHAAPPVEEECVGDEELDDAHMRLNGKLPTAFPLSKFEQAFGARDPESGANHCAGSAAYAKTIFKGGASFSVSKTNVVAPDLFVFTANDFVQYKRTTLRTTTTVADVKRAFGCAVQDIEESEKRGRDTWQSVYVRYGVGAKSRRTDDDSPDDPNNHRVYQLLFINGKLYAMQWEQSCN